MKHLVKAALREAFKLYYRAKVVLLKPLLGPDAAAAVLHDALLPDLVLRLYGARIGENTRINRWLSLHETNNDFSNLTIGSNVHMGKHVFIDLSGPVTIGDRVGVGHHAMIFTHQNFGHSSVSDHYGIQIRPVTIPDDCIVGVGTIVLHKAEWQEGSLLYPGSVLGTAFDRPALLQGIPPKPVRFHDTPGASRAA